MGNLWWVALVLMVFGFQQWIFFQDLEHHKANAKVRRAMFRGEAFAHNYRMWKRVYREILVNWKGRSVMDIDVKKLNEFELDEFKRDIEREIERRASGPTRVVYVVTEWGERRAFADFRCAAICFSDIAKGVMEDAATEEGKEIYDLNKGTLLYGIRPVEMTLNDFEIKVAQKYFDDVCYEKRLSELFPGTEETS